MSWVIDGFLFFVKTVALLCFLALPYLFWDIWRQWKAGK